MPISLRCDSVSGITGDARPRPPADASRSCASPTSGDPTDDLGRLVSLATSNEGLFVALGKISGRLREVRAYLAVEGSNHRLGTACYAYWRDRHSGVLALLRANRL